MIKRNFYILNCCYKDGHFKMLHWLISKLNILDYEYVHKSGKFKEIFK